jgi:alginate O-acetyltransferase complex protein AlgI
MAFIPLYIFILGFTIIIDYVAGIFIESADSRNRKFLLVLSLAANIGVLAVFKYYNFIQHNFHFLLKGFALHNPLPYLNILLPIGLSFHTFQAMSYTIEVYRGNQKAERHFGIYALYVMFYPQLVAGPIERPQSLLHQFREKHYFDNARVTEGLKMMLWGFFKKLVIADRLAIYVNAVYNNPKQHNGATFALATIFFAFQIYCDFSGYSDIAIGAARVMGFKLMTNFNRPYLAKNISEFWKRWHISLSTWFRDYLYIPLGGSRVPIPRFYFNLLFVFIVSGLWHGANWTFISWGALNGLLLIFENFANSFLKKKRPFKGLKKFGGLRKASGILITFLLICLAWVFFRANTLTDAIYILKAIFAFRGPLFIDGNPSMLIYSFTGIAILIAAELKHEFYKGGVSLFNNSNWVVRNLSYAGVIALILLIGVLDGGQFIYFQF